MLGTITLYRNLFENITWETRHRQVCYNTMDRKFIGQVSEYKLLKKDTTSYSQLVGIYFICDELFQCTIDYGTRTKGGLLICR
jgi:hypothetical protein